MQPPRDELVWTIAHALWRHQQSLPRPGRRATGWPPSIEEFMAVARHVVEHVELARFEVQRKPLRPGHRTP